MVKVKVNEGVLVGEKVISTLGGPFYSFKGIPYAARPVGNLRFKAPQPPKPWEGERSATQFGPQCPQYDFLKRKKDPGDEDCLYLNVYTPNISPSAPLPVMIYIHGGGLVFGNANDDLYGPEFLIRHGVILVTFNYRLEVLGFLCLDSEDVPGNAGIKDQVAAMKWVKDNISSFGGDPKNITIFGQSSGAACVTFHCVSPMTKGLFKRAIAQSGSMLSWWATTYKARERSIALARRLGCTSEDDEELYNFFKAQPWDKLVGIQEHMTWKETDDYIFYPAQFGVVSEKRFQNTETYFSGDVIEALRNDIHEDIEIIIGANEDDGIIMLAHSYDIVKSVDSANYSDSFFIPVNFSYKYTLDEVKDSAKKLKSFYTKDKTIVKGDLRPISKYYTVELYTYGILQFAKFFAAKNKTYLYRFSCRSERNMFTKILGLSSHFPNDTVCHNDEIAYLFPLKCINQVINKSSDTFIMIERMTKLWTNFAKFGNPTPDTKLGCNWKHFNAKGEPYLNIGDKLVRSMKYFDKEEIELWDSIYEKHFPELIYRP